MYSLQDITTCPDGSIELETFGLVREEETRPLSKHRFEWAFGLEQGTFDTSSHSNLLTVHKDLVGLFRSQSLVFSPVPSVLERAFSMMEHNKRTHSLNDRQRFEDFGSGVWEYILFSTKGRGRSVPPLYRRLPDGTTTPFLFDLSDPEKLPHFTSTIHPLFVLFFRKLTMISIMRVEPSLWEHVGHPVQKMTNRWPLWTHNRFLPQITWPIRKRPAAADYCRCEECRKWECGSSSGSEEVSTPSDSSDDSEPWRDPNSVKEFAQDDSRVKTWSLQTESSSEECEFDPVLEQYSLEATRPFEEVLERLGEAMRRRLERLKLIQDAKPIHYGRRG
ncbi:hypothetical protein PM082_000273 [Marasmius tenuissimus]|nr:hypothetical protein PM082_000273 [Marasmius tenuissimus]